MTEMSSEGVTTSTYPVGFSAAVEPRPQECGPWIEIQGRYTKATLTVALAEPHHTEFVWLCLFCGLSAHYGN